MIGIVIGVNLHQAVINTANAFWKESTINLEKILESFAIKTMIANHFIVYPMNECSVKKENIDCINSYQCNKGLLCDPDSNTCYNYEIFGNINECGYLSLEE